MKVDRELSVYRRQNSLVINKGIHEQPLLNEALPLRLLSLKVSVHVIGHDDAVRLVAQLDDETVVVTDHPFARNTSRWREHHNLPFLQVSENVLIFKPSITSQLNL